MTETERLGEFGVDEGAISAFRIISAVAAAVALPAVALLLWNQSLIDGGARTFLADQGKVAARIPAWVFSSCVIIGVYGASTAFDFAFILVWIHRIRSGRRPLSWLFFTPIVLSIIPVSIYLYQLAASIPALVIAATVCILVLAYVGVTVLRVRARSRQLGDGTR